MLIPLLADVTVPDPASYMNVGFFILTLAAVAAAGNQIVGFFLKLRNLRTPMAGEVTNDRVKALEDEVSNIELRIERHMGSIETEIRGLTKTLTSIVSDFNYAVGRMDGRSETDGGN